MTTLRTTLIWVAGLTLAAVGFTATQRQGPSLRAEPDSATDALSAQSIIPLAHVTSFRCKFDVAASGEYGPSGWRVEKDGGFGDDILVFTQMDTASSTAQMVGNAGTASVLMMREDETLSFFEASMTGNPILTTIFTGHHVGTPGYRLGKGTVESNEYLSVMSRHIGRIAGAQPSVSQNYGICKAII